MAECQTTSLVFIILLGAAMLTAAFRAFGGEEVVKHFLSSLPGGFLVTVHRGYARNISLRFFLDFIEIAVVVVPIVAPILLGGSICEYYSGMAWCYDWSEYSNLIFNTSFWFCVVLH